MVKTMQIERIHSGQCSNQACILALWDPLSNSVVSSFRQQRFILLVPVTHLAGALGTLINKNHLIK